VNRAYKSPILSDPQWQRSYTSAFDNSSHLARVEVLGENPLLPALAKPNVLKQHADMRAAFIESCVLVQYLIVFIPLEVSYPD
jgi:hypothetical protein